MNDFIEISLLLGFYGQLLTERQLEIMDLHYNGDYSLGEISEQLNISRQGVYDNIKRGKASLYELESKLGLAGRFTAQKEKLAKLISKFGQIDRDSLQDKDRNIIEEVRTGLESLIEELG